MLRKLIRWFWRLGNIELPIGEPWFAVYWPTYFMRGLLWPIRWQGWATIFAFVLWFLGSIATFAYVGWTLGNLTFYFWLFPTIAIFAGVVGAKSEAR
jgi:hypothetical protein